MISLVNVTKFIKNRMVLDNLNYTFEEGKVYGICGPNGSGKTMLLRVICGLVIPTSGTITIDQEVLHKDISFPRSVGVIIENMKLRTDLTAFENLEELGKIKNVVTKDDINKMLNEVGLNSDLPVKKFSLGMCQKLNIAQAIYEKPDILLLDEPTNALDEQAVENFYRIIEQERKRGAIILIATHHNQEIKGVVDVMVKMNEGRIVE